MTDAPLEVRYDAPNAFTMILFDVYGCRWRLEVWVCAYCCGEANPPGKLKKATLLHWSLKWPLVTYPTVVRVSTTGYFKGFIVE